MEINIDPKVFENEVNDIIKNKMGRHIGKSSVPKTWRPVDMVSQVTKQLHDKEQDKYWRSL